VAVLDHLALAAWAYAVAVVVADERLTPRLAPGPAAEGSVTVIVPARDEERDVERTLRGVRASAHADVQVVAVDDESTDGTRAAMRRVEGVEVPAGTPPPGGWLGKPWACAQGARRARGAWLLFCDADVRVAPWTIDAALRLAQEREAAGATVFPGLALESRAERLVMPAAGLLMQTAIVPTWLARRPTSSVAIGVGGFMLVRRDAYDAIGGHGAVREEVVEDLALARALKRAGAPLAWARGDEAVRLRMYHGVRELWTGWRKNAANAWDAPPLATAAGAAAIGAIVWAPWAGAVRRRPHRGRGARAAVPRAARPGARARPAALLRADGAGGSGVPRGRRGGVRAGQDARARRALARARAARGTVRWSSAPARSHRVARTMWRLGCRGCRRNRPCARSNVVRVASRLRSGARMVPRGAVLGPGA
jgi:hypothetical protein